MTNNYYNNNNNNSSGGTDVLGVLQIILIVLKCLNLIHWTWMQVFIPTFIGVGLLVLVLLISIIALLVEDR